MAQAFGALLITSPTGQEQIRADNTGSLLTDVALAQVRDCIGYAKITPSTGGTFTATNGQHEVVILGTTTLTTFNVVLPASPYDGQNFNIYSKPAISTLTITAPGSATLNDTVASLSATSNVRFLYSLSNTTWDRDD